MTATSQESIDARLWDIAIVGAGPAGAFAAALLAERNYSVLLLEKNGFPREKVCGCCLSARAVALLTKNKLGDCLQQALPICSLALRDKTHSTSLPLEGGVALSRGAFDSALVQAARERGATVCFETTASLAELHPHYRTLLLQQKHCRRQVQARVVISAEGLQSGVRGKSTTLKNTARRGSYIGIGTLLPLGGRDFAPGVITMHCGKAGYLGLVRVEGERVAAAAALRGSWLRDVGGPLAAARALAAEAGNQDTAWFAEGHWQGTPPLTRAPKRRGAARLFSIGDAAGFVEPFTGEGMCWALQSAELLAPLAAEAVEKWDEPLLLHWEKQYRRLLRSAQLRCMLISKVVSSPLMRSAGMLLGQNRLIPAARLGSWVHGSPLPQANQQGAAR